MNKWLRSLRVRLIALTIIAVSSVWALVAVGTWNAAHHELEEVLQDRSAEDRKHVADGVADHLLEPMYFALPVLTVLLAVVISLALRPLQALANDVAERGPDRLDPLPDDAVPTEAEPLVQRLNSLFAAITRALDNERRFTADASHELRTPLAALKAQAQVAQQARNDEERQHALRQIVAGCDRATHLVEQMLMLARLDAPRQSDFVTVDLQALAAEVLASCAEASIQHDSPLLLQEPPDTATTVRGDPVLLAVLLRNLVGNAMKHTPEGTAIEIGIQREGGRLILTVCDDGPGIPPTEQVAVLQRFRRGSETTASGSGLGLSIVQRIAELHGASFLLGPKVGAGGTAARLVFDRTS